MTFDLFYMEAQPKFRCYGVGLFVLDFDNGNGNGNQKRALFELYKEDNTLHCQLLFFKLTGRVL